MSDRHLIGVAGLARLLESGVAFPELASRLEVRTRNQPADASALMDLSTLLFWTTNRDLRKVALKKQRQALQMSQVYHLQPRATAPKLRLLVIMAPGDMTANTPVDCLLEDIDIEVTMLYVLPDRPLPRPLPDHDLIFVAIGQSDGSQPLLRLLSGLSELSAKPVINSPEKISLLTRSGVAKLLKSVPRAAVPASARVVRRDLLQIGRENMPLGKVLEDGRFPIIVRPVDSHGGANLAKIEQASDLSAYLAGLSDKEFYLSNFVDYRSSDGLFRKYRVVLFAGRAFPCHLAISSDWIVHYFNAHMEASEAKRCEEERFMNRFDDEFAQNHRESLAKIYGLLGLDYLVIDCAETQDGKLLIFEIDSAAIVHALDDPAIFPYKLPPMRRVFAAFRDMLIARAHGARGSVMPQATAHAAHGGYSGN